MHTVPERANTRAVLLSAIVLAGTLLGSCVFPSGVQASTWSATGRVNFAAPSWIAEASGTQQPLFAVSCFDAARCKAVGAGGTIRYTRDGGATWRGQANPLAGSSTILYRIACIPPSTCYVIGRPNVILVTHDSGVTWMVRRFALPGSTGDLTDAACVAGQVFDLRGRLALCRLGLLDLSCLSVSTCLVVATLSAQREIGVLGSAVYLTTDGGTSWTRQQIPASSPCRGDCTPANSGVPYPLEWISCGVGVPCRAGGSTFIGSHEGYGTLTIQTRQPGRRWTPVGNSSSTSPDSAVCPTTTRCYGVWTTSPFDPPNEIWRSTDGGANWGAESSGSTRFRRAISCPSAMTCYSVGNQGSITASVNGGPFVAQRSRTSHDLYGINCVTVNVCVAVGNKGAVVARKAR